LKHRLKNALRHLATSGPVSRLFRPLMAGRSTIFMLHRFRDRELGVEGHDPGMLDEAISAIRREGFRTVSAEEILLTAREGGDPSGLVAFTVDDGYADFHQVGAPVFAHHGCPVTVFLATEFLDEGAWLWPDRVRFMMMHTPVDSVCLEVDGETRVLEWRSRGSRGAAFQSLTWLLCGMSVDRRTRALEELGDRLRVGVPGEPLPEFRPMSWDEVREDGRRGVTFGPHSVTHPNMALMEDHELEWEIARSWERIQAETDAGTPIFCFPFGRDEDCPASAGRAMTEAGLSGAVTAVPGHVTVEISRLSPFRLPRFAWPDDMGDLRQILHGLERAKAVVRSWIARDLSSPGSS
jgi:peptidoglycan/xylan/chitin deacetylase (PgdA/CDA1 family)